MNIIILEKRESVETLDEFSLSHSKTDTLIKYETNSYVMF